MARAPRKMSQILDQGHVGGGVLSAESKYGVGGGVMSRRPPARGGQAKRLYPPGKSPTDLQPGGDPGDQARPYGLNSRMKNRK